MIAGELVLAGFEWLTVDGRFLMLVGVDALQSLLDRRKVYVTENRISPVQQAQRNAPHGNPARKIGGSVEGIDNPTPFAVGKGPGLLFCEDTMVGKGFGDRVLQGAIGPFIRFRHQATVGFFPTLHFAKFFQQLLADVVGIGFGEGLYLIPEIAHGLKNKMGQLPFIVPENGVTIGDGFLALANAPRWAY